MSETEGVIQFDYSLTPGDPGLAASLSARLSAWRSVLRDLELLGQHPDRYGGHGYGNLSCRDAQSGFVITASQTSGRARLQPADLVRISKADPGGFRVDAIGALPPSSESLTHAMLYRADTSIRVVFHVHCPLIWSLREALALPTTDADVPYGTPAMATAVAELMSAHAQRPLLFATAGHEDGVFAAGASADDCGTALVACLARARAIATPNEQGS